MRHLSLFLVALLLVGCRLAGAPWDTRSLTPMIESPEIGVDYDVYLSLHCGYANFQWVGFGGTEWSFTENGSADSIYVEGTLRLVSADLATLTVDGVAHPLVPATDDAMCL